VRAATIGEAFAATRGIKGSDAAALKALRALPADQVIDGLNLEGMFKGQLGPYSPPFPDGRIAVNPAAAYAAGNFAHVPVMVGATGDTSPAINCPARYGPVMVLAE